MYDIVLPNVKCFKNNKNQLVWHKKITHILRVFICFCILLYGIARLWLIHTWNYTDMCDTAELPALILIMMNDLPLNILYKWSWMRVYRHIIHKSVFLYLGVSLIDWCKIKKVKWIEWNTAEMKKTNLNLFNIQMRDDETGFMSSTHRASQASHCYRGRQAKLYRTNWIQKS